MRMILKVERIFYYEVFSRNFGLSGFRFNEKNQGFVNSMLFYNFEVLDGFFDGEIGTCSV